MLRSGLRRACVNLYAMATTSTAVPILRRIHPTATAVTSTRRCFATRSPSPVEEAAAAAAATAAKRDTLQQAPLKKEEAALQQQQQQQAGVSPSEFFGILRCVHLFSGGASTDAEELLQYIDSKQLSPSQDSWDALAKAYAKDGKPEQIMKIIRYLESKGAEISPNLIKYLSSAGVLSGSLRNSNQHLHAYLEYRIEDCLKRTFTEALDFWAVHAEKYQTVAGIHLLLETALRRVDEAPIICKDRISLISKSCPEFLQPTEFLAHLILAMLSTGFKEDAIGFTKLFSIPGSHFCAPLRRLADKNDLPLLESFSELLERVYFIEQRQRPPPAAAAKKKKDVAAEEVEDVEAKLSSVSKFSFLLRLWKNPFKRPPKRYTTKPLKQKVYKVDAQKLETLVHSFTRMWVAKAIELEDFDSLLRYEQFAERNGLPILKPRRIIQAN